jgi:RNA 2',3'-cyclic 3'-phosphodiesterase
MTRTFIALEMHAPMQRVLAHIIECAAQELPGLHWVDPASIHLTLAFLGELDDEQLAAAKEATLAAAQDFPTFEYRLTALGVFGSPLQPRVIWIGIEDQPSGQLHGKPLQQLHRVLKRELERRNFAVEKRPFAPHLTLARIKQSLSPTEQQAVQRLLHANQAAATTTLYRVNQLNVMKSELSREGAKYSVLRAYDLR